MSKDKTVWFKKHLHGLAAFLEKDKRFLTLLVLTNDASRTRQVKIPMNAFKCIVAGAVICTLVLSFVLFDYVRLKGHAAELSMLRQENTAQKINLQGFASKLREMESQITRLNIFDRKLRILANIDKHGPDAAQGEVMGIGGDSSAENDAYFTKPGAKVDGLVAHMGDELRQLDAKAKTQEKSFGELHEALMKQSSLLAATPSIWPVRGWLTSGFGQRVSPYTGLVQMHKGLDIANRVNTPVVAPADGIVVKSMWDNNLGKTITIKHGYGVLTTYGHLSELFVRTGQRVKRGEKIAAIGNTGHSTGPHLHYEVVQNGINVNPARFILD